MNSNYIVAVRKLGEDDFQLVRHLDLGEALELFEMYKHDNTNAVIYVLDFDGNEVASKGALQ